MSKADNEFAVEESANYDKPVDVNVESTSKNFRFNRGNVKFLIIVAGVFMAIYFVSSLFQVKKQGFEPASGDVDIPRSSKLEFRDPLAIGEIDKKEKELMVGALNKANKDNSVDVVVPSSALLIVEPPEKKEPSMDRKKSLYSQRQDKPENTIRVSKAYIERLEKQINGVVDDVYDGSLFKMHEKSYKYVADKNENQSEPSKAVSAYRNRVNYPFPIDYLKVIPSEMILGHNSDLGKEMIAKILTGPYRGALLYGTVTTSKYVEQAYMNFTMMVYKNNRYDIEAIAVDQNTNIPAIEGKVKKHLAHNIFYGFGIGFLQAFAESRKFDSIAGTSGVNIPGLGNIGATVNDSGALLESRALEAAGATLSSLGSYRAPTYKKRAYQSIGIVFIPTNINDINDNNEVNEG